MAFAAMQQLGAFDSWTHGTGTVPGEGAAFLVLEDRTRAIRRGARVYATICGHAAGSVAADCPLPQVLADVLRRLAIPRHARIVAAGDGEPAQELSLDDIRLIGRKLNRLGTLIISLAGGEPLLRSDLYDIITALNAAGHFPILITNGWYVDETVARDILRAGLQEISVSVDYREPARHDAQRGCPGAWERAVKALELFHKNRPDRRNRVHMISVLMDDNLDDVEPLILLCRELGVTYI
jgi:hypothetical protein